MLFISFSSLYKMPSSKTILCFILLSFRKFLFVILIKYYITMIKIKNRGRRKTKRRS